MVVFPVLLLNYPPKNNIVATLATMCSVTIAFRWFICMKNVPGCQQLVQRYCTSHISFCSLYDFSGNVKGQFFLRNVRKFQNLWANENQPQYDFAIVFYLLRLRDRLRSAVPRNQWLRHHTWSAKPHSRDSLLLDENH